MKKRSKILARILALVLALSMAVANGVTALAVDRDGSTKYTDGLVVDGSEAWNSGGGDQYLLEGDFDVTITFENTPFIRDNDNWSNFVFELFGGADTKGYTFRADNFGWSYGDGSQEPTFTGTYTWASWEEFQEICKNNPLVTLNLKKTSNTVVTATMEFGSAATEVYTITYPAGVPSSMRVQVGSDGGSVKILECKFNHAVVTKDDLAVEGFVSAVTDADTASGNFSIVYTFHNASQDTSANWNNFTVEVWGDSFGITARADAYGWGYNGTEPGLTWISDIDDWDTFRADMADANVTVTIERIDKVITFTYDIVAAGGNTYHVVGTTAELEIPEVLYAHLTGEKVVLSDIKATIYELVYTDNSADDDDPGSGDGDIHYGTTADWVSVHDPSIVKDPTTGTYYIFGSHMAWAKTDDLINWTTFTNNINTDYATIFAEPASWAAKGSSSYDVSGNLWAPDVIYNETMGKWCMYMSVNGDNWYSSIVLLTADNIEGPYTYVGPVVYSGFTNATEAAETDLFDVIGGNTFPDRYLQNRNGNRTYGLNAIDPCVTYDDEGNLWMTYGSWFGGIYMLKLDAATGLRDYNYTYQTVDNVSDEYQGLKIAGGQHSSGEASYLEKIGDYWYLFMTYGGLTANGGYNMRVFRSESITGPYVDLSGDAANYTSYSNNTNGTIGNRLMSYYKWNYMDTGYVAQGHNSALQDSDGKAYLVYHTRFNNAGEAHQVRVHQLFTNEDGWLVTAPFAYAGETLSQAGFTAEEVAGSYEVLFHKGTDYANLECVTGSEVIFGEDGTLSGAMTGTWTSSGPYVTLTSGSTTYKGVFIEQKMEDRDEVTLCFTVIGSDEISVWGYQYPYDDEDFIDMAAEELGIPIGTFGQNITLPASGLYDVSITWTSDNAAVITDDGVVTVPAEDTVVTLTATMTYGSTTKTYEYPVKVFASRQNATEAYLLWEYFTGEEVDLSGAVQGTYVYPNPFNGDNVLGVSIYNGVSIEFEVTPNGSMEFLSNILSMNAGAQGGLYFTGGSYLGYNATGGWFDANVDNSAWVAGTDFIGAGAKVRIDLSPTGFAVYFNDEMKFTQDSVGDDVPGSSAIDGYSSVLNYLRGAATDLNFGWGSWWNGGFNGTISNVKLYVQPTDTADTTGCVYFEDYNSTSDTGWTSPNAQSSLTIKNDGDEHNGYVNYAAETGVSGNRGAYMNFPEDANLSGKYMVEADIKMTPGNVADRSVSQFAITGTDVAFDSNNYNNGIVSGYILKLSTSAANSTVYTINDGDDTVNIPANTWVHIKATVSNDTDVLVEITINGETQTFNTQVNGSGELKGLYFLRGRGTGAAAIDNIAVRYAWIIVDPKTDENGDVTEIEVTIPEELADSDDVLTLPTQVEAAEDAESAPEIEITVTGGGSATVEIPVSNMGPGVVVIIVDENGNETVVRDGIVTEDGVVIYVEGNVTVKIVENSKYFEDIDTVPWAEDAINFASARELINGVEEGRFAPDEFATRAMAVVVLHRLTYEPHADMAAFEDVVGDAWYAEAVAWAKTSGVVNGVSESEFAPDDYLTREQFVTMLYRYAVLRGADVSASDDLTRFSDAANVSDWARNAMEWAVASGIVNGVSADRLDPTGYATRAEMVVMLARLCNVIFA